MPSDEWIYVEDNSIPEGMYMVTIPLKIEFLNACNNYIIPPVVKPKRKKVQGTKKWVKRRK